MKTITAHAFLRLTLLCAAFRSFLGVRFLLAPLFVACCLCLSTSNLVAEVTFDWATVGNPNNPPDQLYVDAVHNPNNLRFGSVANIYRISKYEVTNDQYTEFLNAVDPMGTNPNSVYFFRMGSDPRGGIAFSAGAANGSKYSSKTNMSNKPVNYVSYFDSMRFVNWLENGQPTDGGGTESGVYAIGNGLNETRTPGATFFIPSEDEWYKAAYYDPRSAVQGGPPGDDNYWLYPTSSDTVPTMATANATGDTSSPGTNVANYNLGADWNGQDGNVTTVGSAGASSASFYGTFDQGGNVWEWNEAVIRQPNGLFARGMRGGEWDSNVPFHLAALGRVLGINQPENLSDGHGFRVASVAEQPVTADLNGDGSIDCVDVDSLVAEVVAGSNSASFDLTGDGLVNIADLDRWRVQAGAVNLPSGAPYLEGDATLDGTVDTSDFNIWNTHKFTNVAAWCSGDFNADGSVDVADFGIWNANKFTSSAGLSAVPEPSMGVFLIAALFGLAAFRKG